MRKSRFSEPRIIVAPVVILRSHYPTNQRLSSSFFSVAQLQLEVERKTAKIRSGLNFKNNLGPPRTSDQKDQTELSGGEEEKAKNRADRQG